MIILIKNKLSNIIIMFKENGKTIFDDNKPFKIEHSNIPEYEIFEEGKKFNINRDKFNYDMIIDDHKIPSFKFVMDNSLNDFYQFPDVGLLSQNPEYKYKYLHLSPAEYIKQQYQTESGTPNELNTYMRSIEIGEPIEDIKQFDNSYQAGLDELKKIINEEAEFIKNSYESTKKQENKEAVLKIGEEFNKKKEEMFKQLPNPVKIKEALPRLSNDKVPTEQQAKNIIRKDANKEIGTYRKEIEKILSTEKDKKVTKDMMQKINKAFKGSKSISSQPQPTTPSKPSSRAPSRAPSPQPMKTPSRAPSPQPVKTDDKEIKEVMDKLISDVESKNSSEQKKKPLKLSETQAGKERAKIIEKQKEKAKNKGLLKELADELENEKATKIQSLVRKNLAKKTVEEKRKSIDSNDEKTVIDDTTPTTETYKINVQGFKNLIKKFSALDDKTNIDELLQKDQVKLKGYMKAIGIPSQTKTLKGLRKKYSIL